ncbi:MAG: phosphoribosylanthranilate isomerase [Actinomycetota bacterium]
MFVKICGITTEEDALLAVAMGADSVGFIFAPSTRQVAPARVQTIVPRLPPETTTIGVFRDADREQVVQTVDQCGLRGAQLHGHESVEDSMWVAERVGVMIKAFVAGESELDRVAEYGAHAILVEGPTPGSGQVFDWSLMDRVPLGQRVILSGGLDPDNVARGIEQVGPWGVDVATGVESTTGHKDARKVRAFVANARAAVGPASRRPAAADTSGSMPYDWQLDP